MVPKRFKVVRDDGAVLSDESAAPLLIEHGSPGVWSYDLEGLPVMRNGDKMVVVYGGTEE
jgi:hypothetical protein